MMATATQLIDRLATCTICGKIHKPVTMGNRTSWAAPDGHSYRTYLFQDRGWSDAGFFEYLRQVAGRL
jgi:hypothetical protein